MEERLQKIIANVGIASRRKAEELILTGFVTVNGKTIKELGTKANPERDHIKVRGKLINAKISHKEKIYILLNKPVGYLSSTSDPKKRPLVTDLAGEFRSQVHPVGRLDFNSEGLILLSNDGDFTNLIAHATSKIPKRYEVKIKASHNFSLLGCISNNGRKNVRDRTIIKLKLNSSCFINSGAGQF